MAHLKTFSKWIHKHRTFPLSYSIAKNKLQPIGSGLKIERAITTAERRRRNPDAADMHSVVGIIKGSEQIERKRNTRMKWLPSMQKSCYYLHPDRD
jgi:hypothetical protein